MDTFGQDVRYAIRTLGRTPLLTGLAILCLALGIGANAIDVQRGQLHADAAAAVPRAGAARSTPGRRGRRRVAGRSVSYPDFLDWQRESTSFETLTAVQSRSLTLSGTDDPERVQGAAISAGLFTMLGIAPALGRDIARSRRRAGAAPVILLTDQLWRRRYNVRSGASSARPSK